MELEITKIETDMKKPCIIVDGYTYRINMELKCQEISWRCSMSRKKCHARLRIDQDVTKVLSGSLEHNQKSVALNL